MSTEGTPKPESKINKGTKAAMAGAALLGAVGSVEVPAQAAPLQNKIEAQESFDANKEASAFIEKMASLSINDRVLPNARMKQQFEIFAATLQQKRLYFSLAPQGSLSPAAPATGASTEVYEQALTILKQKLDAIDTKIKLGDPGTEQGKRKNYLRILKEVLSSL